MEMKTAMLLEFGPVKIYLCSTFKLIMEFSIVLQEAVISSFKACPSI